nr:hypothetical protein [Tanacetum cinerariifolium]
MEEDEEEEMEMDDEMDDPEVIHPYEIEENELPPPPAKSDISFDTKPEVEAEVEDETEVLAPGPMGKDVDTLHQREYFGRPSAGLMHENRKEKERLKKKLKVVQEEKEQVEQDLRNVVVWIREHFGVEIPPLVDEERPIKANSDMTTLNDTQPSESRRSHRDS